VPDIVLDHGEPVILGVLPRECDPIPFEVA
jgi:hypothetical protein